MYELYSTQRGKLKNLFFTNYPQNIIFYLDGKSEGVAFSGGLHVNLPQKA